MEDNHSPMALQRNLILHSFSIHYLSNRLLSYSVRLHHFFLLYRNLPPNLNLIPLITNLQQCQRLYPAITVLLFLRLPKPPDSSILAYPSTTFVSRSKMLRIYHSELDVLLKAPDGFDTTSNRRIRLFH